MAEDTAYLEQSETDGATHKFYEVVTENTQVRIRYGRIGDQGQTQVSTHATTEMAQKFAQKKLRDKLNKGYEHDAAQGVILECFRDGSRLRMRVTSAGYDATLRVQFPQNIREEHARYIVDEVRLNTDGNFYRVHGDIRRLV
ncbi:MAG: WGR domain-containing protein [Ktedonobacteraceae bacterium]|nr:WGR domain-containing protein [Ktedonobacteraceae bacterium]